MACSRRVQCRVLSSVNLSASDQTLRNGSKVTSGTAGGRRFSASATPEIPIRLGNAIKKAIRLVLTLVMTNIPTGKLRRRVLQPVVQATALIRTASENYCSSTSLGTVQLGIS